MRRLLKALCAGLIAGIGASTAASGQDNTKDAGPVARGDPIFDRFPELRTRYFDGGQSTIAKHKFIAMPLPKQCAYFYVDVYSSGNMSNHDTRTKAKNDCQANMQKYGALNENYGVPCVCEVVIGRDVYRTGPETLPGRSGYAPVSLFFRAANGGQTQHHGYTEFDLYLKPGGGRNTITVFNPAGTKVCTGTIDIPGARTGDFHLDCGAGRQSLKVNGTLTYYNTPVKEHSVGRGSTADGGSATVVIGLPANTARQRYGVQ